MEEPGFTALAQARVTIVGLGLMGGSLALALRGHCRELVGVDIDPAALSRAVAGRVVDRAGTLAEARNSDLLILAAPARVILEHLAQLAVLPPPSQPVVVLDLGSTKAAITQAMSALPPPYDPIGGHPMCGKEVNGLEHADSALFRERVFVLSPLPRTSRHALTSAQALVAAVGARPVLLDPDRHDALAAHISHLPYIAASLLVAAAERAHDDGAWLLAASGFRDTTRLAASDVSMMIDILLTNRAAILEALGRYAAEMENLAGLVAASDGEALRALLAPVQARRRSLFTDEEGH